jgi:Flp pilus assembly protein TadD
MDRAIPLHQQVQASAERLYASGYAALSDGNAAAAQRYFGLMLAVAPFDERPWIGLAASRERLGDHRVAAGLYQLAAAVSPNPALPLLGQARAYLALYRPRRAEALLDQAEASTDDPAMLSVIESMRRKR